MLSVVALPRVELPSTFKFPFTSKIAESIFTSPPAAFIFKFPDDVSIVLSVVCAI